MLALCRWPIVVLAVSWATPVAAQPSPSVADTADRPGFADSPVLIGRGHVQIEFGFTAEHEGNDRSFVHSFTLPQTELHAGVSSRLDVSVIWDGFVSATTATSVSGSETHDKGYADFRVGAKLSLVHRPRIDAALIGYLNAPVGSAFVTGGYADPAARFAWGAQVSDRIGVSGTVDLKGVRDEDDRAHSKPAASALLSGGIAGSLDGFVGFVAEPPALHSRPTVVSVEEGLVLALGARNQIDVWASRRLAGGPDDWFISAGFSRRLR